MENLGIGEVARRAGVQPSAIRYYERVGLLPPPRRVGGRRRYGPDVLTRLTVVRMAQEAGFTVAEMRALFHGFPDDTPASLRWRAFTERKVGEMDAIIARVGRMREVLNESMRCGCLTLDACALVG
jgi:MerR family redox-sensitive transcriptional activator SoxR